LKKIEQVAETFSHLQATICRVLEAANGKGKFSNDEWNKEIGCGVTRVIGNGKIIEKGAVNFSLVRGNFSEHMELILGEKADKYAATGLSSILHPSNPWIPTIHLNVRYFALDNGVSWFGGGIDLTPSIIIPEQAAWFHQQIKEICDRFNPAFYPEFKIWADDYYFLPHRNETRGIGGIFYDRVKPNEQNSFETLLDFAAAQASAYPEIYSEFMKNSTKAFSDREKNWQNLRRGRYVEFNLLNDRGTKFGLESGGNTESIMVSMPPNASWEYNYFPEPGGFEEKTLTLLKKDINWIGYKPE